MFFRQSDYAIKITGVYHIARRPVRYATPPREVTVLSYRLRGSTRIEQGSRVLSAGTEDVLFFPPQVAYTQETAGEEVIAVHLEIPGVQERQIEQLHLARPELAQRCFPELLQAWENGQYYRCCAVLYAFLHEICVPHCADGTGCAGYSLLSPALTAIRTEYADPQLEIPELARRCGLSESYFRRMFRRAYSMPPVQYLNRLRIAKAKNLLLSGVSVVEAAAACGFEDPKYFSTLFHRLTGCAPSAWKNQTRGG